MDKVTNPIKDWLKSTGRSARWLAAEVGVTEEHISRIANDKLAPSRPLILALENVSQGGIPSARWAAE